MMKMKRFISVVLLSLLASLFQGMSTANAAVAPGRPAFSGATCNGSYDIWNFTMTSTDTVTGFKYAFTDNLTSTAPTTLYDFAGTFTQSGNNFTIRFNYSDFVARGVGHGQVVRPWIQGVSSSEIGPVNNNSGLACTTDFVAPTLSSTSASLTSATSASLRFTSDDAGQWTHYYLVYESTDAAPTAETVIAQGAVSPTVAKGTSTSTSASRSVTVSGLTAGRSYTAYVVARDYGANTSTVSTIEIKIGTPD
jgi:hypothetical protein